VMLPDMSGRALAADVLRLHPEAKALYMSGYTDDAIVRMGVFEAGVMFLPKPFTADALGAKVREALGWRASTSDARADC